MRGLLAYCLLEEVSNKSKSWPSILAWLVEYKECRHFMIKQIKQDENQSESSREQSQQRIREQSKKAQIQHERN
jgi:hypothetical protein